ncbi:hypothetical protein NNJEOMEG_03818 [Fundidesulfovibrio magnetotacticus]|uniref:TonB C-terminal domain-containing protein n=1 Tax=Fundidesulfovibrio magnetotacticus TaxID=2730080 RepID=A0A6V8M5T3_9BACT|nr:energy transducer TonB [Fundidesulfovibrio magnetotacticus]GFK95945.1 hypothetical protein NNJEOMEG_03818 [Fundidesulfovibrio magnetotacticus]
MRRLTQALAFLLLLAPSLALAQARMPDEYLVDPAAQARKPRQPANDAGKNPAAKPTGKSDPNQQAILRLYAVEVMAALQQQWRIVATPTQYSCVVEVAVNAQGEVRSSRLIETSGQKNFDDSTLKAVQNTPQLPAPPSGKPTTLRLTFKSR